MQLTKEVFKQVKKIVSADDLSTTAVSVAVGGDCVTVRAVAGNVWINPLATAVADDTAILLPVGTELSLSVKDSLSLISDATGATYQVIFWKL